MSLPGKIINAADISPVISFTKYNRNKYIYQSFPKNRNKSDKLQIPTRKDQLHGKKSPAAGEDAERRRSMQKKCRQDPLYGKVIRSENRMKGGTVCTAPNRRRLNDLHCYHSGNLKAITSGRAGDDPA